MGGVALAQGPAANNASSSETVDCTLLVPPNPLTAAGLATPYRLVAPCHQADSDTAAFVQATIVDPASGQVSVYDPLVIDENSQPAVRPRAPRLPTGAVVGIWFGFNGDNLRLGGSSGSLRAGSCVNGLDASIFGQFAYCNAPAFFNTAQAAVAAGKLHVPALGTARDGRPCPTVRDFSLVDMDQSDNVTTSYLTLPDGRIAQNTSANAAALASQGARIEINGSDNALLDAFVAPSLGCVPFTAPDLAEPGRVATALALNELQAGAYQAAPVALVPVNDPMVQVDGRPSTMKANLYRSGVGQPFVNPATDTATAYCQDLVVDGIPRVQLDRRYTRHMVSPDSGAANSLFTFLAQRLSGSFEELGCADLLGQHNPVHLVMDGDVVVDATFSTAPPPSKAPSPAPTPSSAAPVGSVPPTGSVPPSVFGSPPVVPPTVGPSAPVPSRPPLVGQPHHSAQPPPPPPATTSPPAKATPQPPDGDDTYTATPVIRPAPVLGDGSGGGSGDSSGGDQPPGSPIPAQSGTGTGAGTGAAPATSPAASAAAGGANGGGAGTTAIKVEPMKARTTNAGLRTTSGIQIPRFAGGVLVGAGAMFFLGLVVYGLNGRRQRREYLSY